METFFGICGLFVAIPPLWLFFRYWGFRTPGQFTYESYRYEDEDMARARKFVATIIVGGVAIVWIALWYRSVFGEHPDTKNAEPANVQGAKKAEAIQLGPAHE
jgi:hypothetical protein